MSAGSGAEVEEVIVLVWESLDYICAERLTPVLLPMAQHVARFGAVKLREEIEEQLKTISRATVSRILHRYRSRTSTLAAEGSGACEPGDQRSAYETDSLGRHGAGHFEVDLVYHCGASVAQGKIAIPFRWSMWLPDGANASPCRDEANEPWKRGSSSSWPCALSPRGIAS